MALIWLGGAWPIAPPGDCVVGPVFRIRLRPIGKKVDPVEWPMVERPLVERLEADRPVFSGQGPEAPPRAVNATDRVRASRPALPMFPWLPVAPVVLFLVSDFLPFAGRDSYEQGDQRNRHKNDECVQGRHCRENHRNDRRRDDQHGGGCELHHVLSRLLLLVDSVQRIHPAGHGPAAVRVRPVDFASAVWPVNRWVSWPT